MCTHMGCQHCRPQDTAFYQSCCNSFLFTLLAMKLTLITFRQYMCLETVCFLYLCCVLICPEVRTATLGYMHAFYSTDLRIETPEIFKNLQLESLWCHMQIVMPKGIGPLCTSHCTSNFLFVTCGMSLLQRAYFSQQFFFGDLLIFVFYN